MMKKQLAIMTMGLALIGGTSFAVAGQDMSTHNYKKNVITKKSIILYKKPTTSSRVVVALNPYQARLIPIYDHGEWVKVGEASDGTVGWLNKKQYVKVMQAAAVEQKPHYIKVNEVMQPGKQPQVNVFYDGKPVSKDQSVKNASMISMRSERGPDGKVTIVAYKDGKKLPPEQTKQLYRQMFGAMPVGAPTVAGGKSLPVTADPRYSAQSYQVAVPPQVEQMLVQSMQQFYQMDRALIQQMAVQNQMPQQPQPGFVAQQGYQGQQPMRVVVVPVYNPASN